MRGLLQLLLLTLFHVASFCQAPFSPTIREKAKVDSLAQGDEATSTDLDKADFFDHFNANMVSIQNGGKLFPTINGEVVNYKLGLWESKIYASKDEQTTGKKAIKNNNKPIKTLSKTHYLPLSVITNVSGNYLDPEAGTTNDATSFFGAPLTFRFAPGFDLTPFNTANKLFFGTNIDARLLAIGDTTTNDIEAGWGAYTSAGFTYMGLGFVTDPEDDSKRYDGKWSFSTIFYWFKSGGKFNKAVFGDYEKKSLTGIEMLLRFKTNQEEHSKFNLLIGASNGFTRDAPNFAKWQFRIGVGN